MQKNWSTFKSNIQSNSKIHQYKSIPPKNLKVFQPLEEPSVEILMSFETNDRFGNTRLQLYILNNNPPTEALLRTILGKYKGNYDIVWMNLVTKKDHVEQENWNAQAAWFAAKIPFSEHYLGFETEHQIDRFYWHYE